MENPSIADAPPPAGPGAQQPFAQLPPQMFTTAAQLLDLTDSTGPRESEKKAGKGELEGKTVLTSVSLETLQKNSW